MTNMFLSFLEISIPISLIIVLLLLLTPVLNKRYAAKWKYWIWIVLTLRLIIPLGGNGRQPVADMQPQMADQALLSTLHKQKENCSINRVLWRETYYEKTIQEYFS